MVAACPKCKARYRVDEKRIGAEGVRLKCAKCEAVFRVRVPQAPSDVTTPTAAPVNPETAGAPTQGDPGTTVPPELRTPVSSELSVPRESARAPAPGEGEVVDRERVVLVADPDVESGKATASAISGWGLQPILVHDGVEAMLTIQRMLPRVVVLDAALPKMYGFQVCEIIKRNESLRNTGVVLVGAIHNRDRYRRAPVELYGADHYLEQPDLPDGLAPLLTQMGMGDLGGDRHATPAPPPALDPAPPPVAAPQASPPPQSVAASPATESLEIEAPPRVLPPPAAPVADDGNADEREKAARLARIVVSDIVLYHPEKFTEAVSQGNVVEAMDAEVEEGRVLFRQRINEQVRGERDHLVEELLRVARERGMQ